MPVYTSYYGNYRKFPEKSFRIGISSTIPKNSVDATINLLAPSRAQVKALKDRRVKSSEFEERYLERLTYLYNNFPEILERLVGWNKCGDTILLLCYEKSEDFCHRHLLSKFLNEHYDLGIKEL